MTAIRKYATVASSASQSGMSEGPRFLMPVVITHRVDAALTGTNAADSMEIFRVPDSMEVYEVRSCHFVPDASLTANDTNFATLNVQRTDSSGNQVGQIGYTTTETTAQSNGSGNWTAMIPVNMPNVGQTVPAAGESIIFSINKVASGVTVPKGVLVLVLGIIPG